MSSRKSSPPLRIEPRPSRIYTGLIAAIYLLCLLAIYLAAIEWTWKLLLVVALFVYFGISGRHHILLSGRHNVTLALWDENDQWRIRLAKGSTQNAQLLADSLNHPQLVILRFKTLSGHRYSLPLFRDSIPAHLHRRLRARLTVYAASQAAGDLQ
jgi:hypothetical protein